jgi:predicted outer membrane repeat protein
MKKIIIFLSLLVLFISISVVSAEGNFSALQDQIDSSTDSISITQNYVFDNKTDYRLTDGITINKTNFVINGNGHTIDGANLSRIFKINGGNNITISNLTLINGKHNYGGAIITTTMTNIHYVTFSGNTAKEGGAIYSFKDTLLTNSKFENNIATYGGAIYNEGYFEIQKCNFNKNNATWGGSIYSKKDVRVVNSEIRNSQSKYAPAIYAQNILLVRNSVLENLYSNETAGAIAVKDISTVEIDGCNFTNTHSRKNGGAIFVDAGTEYENPNLSVLNSRFINSSADYGGALVQLGGKIFINHCEFTDNTALYNGGAIYLSFLNAVINNTSIKGNKLSTENYSCGGGIYCDVFKITIENSEFINNSYNGVYAYDSELTMQNTRFTNNGEAIHGVFLSYDLKDIYPGKDKIILNDTDYDSDFYEISNVVLITNNITVTNLPSRYDSRDWGWVSSVKDQGDMGSCWTFGTCGALESTLLKVTGIEYDFSENNMQNSMLQYSKYGIVGMKEGGIREQGLEYVLSWFGMMPSEFDTYDELGKLSPLISSNDKIHIFDAMFADARNNATDNDALKRLIIQCGSVTTGYYQNASCYNEKTFSYYQTLKNDTNHAITIVGWDDNYPASKFLVTPPGNGAFIIKNSWGTDFGENGFMYISYYDTSLLNTTFAIGFLIENNENYTMNYQTDLGGRLNRITNNSNIISYKNTYEANGKESISAIGTYFEKNENYTIEIYVNDKLVHTQSGTAPFTGYHTVKLTKEIPLVNGDNFTAVMKKTMVPLLTSSRQLYLKNMSFVNYGHGWEDLAPQKKTCSLKVYTKGLIIRTEDLVKIYKNETQFKADIGIANETVNFEVNGKNYTRVSDGDGIATMTINLGPGKDYIIKTYFEGLVYENTIEILPTLIADDLVKYYRNDSQFYITLIDGAGNPVSDAEILMNINGVFYSKITNENGTAKLNINLGPGEYILTAIDPYTSLMMSYTITVLPTLIAEDLNMTYLDGSTFKVQLVDGQGMPLAGKTVKLNINGVIYSKNTNSLGIAELNIRLMPGEYIITSEYENARISNTITITEKED